MRWLSSSAAAENSNDAQHLLPRALSTAQYGRGKVQNSVFLARAQEIPHFSTLANSRHIFFTV